MAGYRCFFFIILISSYIGWESDQEPPLRWYNASGYSSILKADSLPNYLLLNIYISYSSSLFSNTSQLQFQLSSSDQATGSLALLSTLIWRPLLYNSTTSTFELQCSIMSENQLSAYYVVRNTSYSSHSGSSTS